MVGDIIDPFSKYAWAQPIEKKTGKDVTDAFAKILKEAQGRKPQTLKTDAAEELYNQTFQELLKKKYIHHFSTHGDAKASIVQRFNRILKSKLYLYFTAANTLKYVDILPKLVINTIAPITGVLKPHPITKKCGTVCMGNIRLRRKRNLHLK